MKNDNNQKRETAINDGSTAIKILSGTFGILAFAIGIVNTFWGNDPGFGVFIILLSLIYFLPVNIILNKQFGFSIPKLGLIRILLALFILWAALGVGELFDKVEMMMNNL